MHISNLSFNISPRHRGYLALFLWAFIVLFILRHNSYGLNEGAARSLLLSWSIADQVASSVTTFGMPDLRALLYLPTGFLWTGNVFAVKVLTVLLLAITSWLLYAWERRISGEECALLATGLLIISPLALDQIDTLSPGVYLLAAFALGSWLDTQYRSNPKPFNGWYFAQLSICAFSVSLHPAGLAYPLALLWSWRTMPSDQKHQRFFLIGIFFVVIFILLIREGWSDLTWFHNPVKNLGIIFTGSALDDTQPLMQWLPGGFVLALLVAVIFKQHRKIWADLTGRILLIGLLLGLLIGDSAWGMIALCIVLYFGLPLLLRPEQDPTGGGFMKHRGWVLLSIFICTTIFMRADRAYYEIGNIGILSAQDELIRTLAVAAENDRKASEADDGEKQRQRFIVASEWPGRTMLACKCDTFPLPPIAQDPQTQLANLHSIAYLLLDPKQTTNIDLARNLALLGGIVETISLQPGGVLLHVKEDVAPKPGEIKPEVKKPS